MTSKVIVDPHTDDVKKGNLMSISFNNDTLSVKSTYYPYVFISKVCGMDEKYNQDTFSC